MNAFNLFTVKVNTKQLGIGYIVNECPLTFFDGGISELRAPSTYMTRLSAAAETNFEIVKANDNNNNNNNNSRPTVKAKVAQYPVRRTA